MTDDRDRLAKVIYESMTAAPPERIWTERHYREVELREALRGEGE